MDKRSRFIAELRRQAKARGLEFREETWRGKGGHAMVWVGDKVTTVPSREIDPKTAKKIRKRSVSIEGSMRSCLSRESPMRTFVYRARFEPGEKRGVIVISFPDVPEAITEGRGEAEATTQAQEALGLALLTYPERDLPLPKPKARGSNLVPIAVEAAVAAKRAFLDAFRETGISKSEFGRKIGKDEKEVRRLLDPKHASKLSTLTEALGILGQRLIVSVEAAA